MTNDSCSVHECREPVKRMGMCYGHYMKSWRYGTPTPTRQRWEDLTGRRFGKLVAQERVEGRASMWKCRCDCGAQKLVRTGDLNRGTVSCGAIGCRKPSTPRRDDIGYWAAHSRVRNDRGPASGYTCVDCAASAYQWSYSHEAEDERISSDEATLGMPYSPDPSDYDPRCVTCHKAFDADRTGCRSPGETPGG